MKVILCDRCKKVLKENDQVIVASIIGYYIDENSEIYKDGIGASILVGTHFCSTKCLKERIQL